MASINLGYQRQSLPPGPALRGASGKGFFWAFAWLAALVSFVYVCTRLIPVYLNNYQLQDEMKDEARFALVEHKDQYQIRQEVYQAAKNLGIRASLDSIDVQPIEGGYRITVNYIVPLRMFNYSFDLRFHPTADSSSI